MTSKKQINKENLLSQGVQLLMEQGYHGTGLKEILDAVEIPKGSFYNYFASKENYAAEVIQHYINPFINQLANHLKNPGQDALTALNRYFDELIEELEDAHFKGGCLLGNLMGEIGDTSDICQQSLLLAVNRYHAVLAIGIKKAQGEGSLRTDKSAEDMADLLLNGWQGAMLRMKIEQSSVPLQQCRDDLLNDYFMK